MEKTGTWEGGEGLSCRPSILSSRWGTAWRLISLISFLPFELLAVRRFVPDVRVGSYYPESPLHFLSSRKREEDPRARGCEEGGEWDQPAMRMRAGKIITLCTPREEYSEPVPGWWAGTEKKGSSGSLKLVLRFCLLSLPHCNINNSIFSLFSFWIY